MKRPRLPQLGIPKKYRDGTLLATLVSVFEENHAAAIATQDPAARFDALLRLEKKINVQHDRAQRAFHGTKKTQTDIGVYGAAGVGTALLCTAIVVAPPLAPFFIAGGAAIGVGGQFGSLIALEVAARRGKKSKNPLNPLAAIERLDALLTQTEKDIAITAKEYPLALIENPRFQELSACTPEISTALTQAFIKAQIEKPAPTPAPDLTSALAKPRQQPPQAKR